MWVPEARRDSRDRLVCLAWTVSKDCRVLLAPQVLRGHQGQLARMASLGQLEARAAKETEA